MTTNAIDLVSLFGTVAKTLNQNKSALNEADTYNHDHGDNMAQIFNLITQAVGEKNGATPADQLKYASQILSQQSSSGSAKIYSEGLSDAAKEFSGKSALTSDNIAQLVQLLLGAAPAAATPASTPTTDSSSAGGDVLGSLLGSLLGGDTGTSAPAQNSQGAQDGIDLGDILNAGMAFMEAKQSGESNLQAIVNALTASSKVGTQDYRAQSGALVAQTILSAVTQLASAKK
jgi:hypothetical protein